MRVVFMGSPPFAAAVLAEIARQGHAIVAVYSQPPKAGGRRGLELVKTAVHELAERLGLPVLTPRSLRESVAQEAFRGHAADVAVVAAYGLLLPKLILDAPILGCVNLHASLLPRWRGAAPIQRAVMAGDPETGVDFMRMEEGLDTGPVGLRERVAIRTSDTSGDLTLALSALAASLAARGLSAMAEDRLEFQPQSDDGACYAHKIAKSEAEIDWRRDATQIRNIIHSLSPMPGAFSFLRAQGQPERIKILRAEAVDQCGPAGTVVDRSFTVACGRGGLRILEAQRAGKLPMSGDELRRGLKIEPGSSFAEPIARLIAP